MVVTHATMGDTAGVMSYVRAFPRSGRSPRNNPILLEIEASLVRPPEPHSHPLSSPRYNVEGSLLVLYTTKKTAALGGGSKVPHHSLQYESRGFMLASTMRFEFTPAKPNVFSLLSFPING